MPVEDAVLWLFVVMLGTVFGARLYEASVVLPLWTHTVTGAFQWNSDLSRRTDAAGRTFWTYVITGPLTLLTLASLYFAWIEPGVRRGWWLGAAGAILLERVATFAYFIPTLAVLQRVTPGNPKTNPTIVGWMQMNHLRVAVTLAAWLAALKALTL